MPLHYWRSLPRTTTGVLVAVTLLTWPAAARQAGRTPADWIAAVNSHVPGAVDAPLKDIATWSRTQVLDAIARLPPRGGAAQLVKRALLLHTDITLAYRTPAGYDLPDSQTAPPLLPRGVQAAGFTPAVTSGVIVGDGMSLGESHGTYHWEAGRRLIATLDVRGADAAAARAWYRTTAAMLQDWGDYPELNVHLGEAQRVLGSDAVLLLYAGSGHHEYSTPAIQLVVDRMRQDARRSMGFTRPASLPGNEVEERATAERLYRAAISLDPTLLEAHIRLGHLLSDRGRHAEAVVELRRGLAGVSSHLLDYYGSLLLGHEEHVLGHVVPAREAYEHASRLYPSAQSPRLALSRLDLVEGDDERARGELVDVLMPRDESNGGDPWARIYRTHEPSAAAHLAEMRRVFVQ